MLAAARALFAVAMALALLVRQTSSKAVFTMGSSKHHNSTELGEIYVLNMDRRADRMGNLSKILNRAGWEYTRFPAIDGRIALNGHADQIKLHKNIKFNFVHWSSIRQELSAYGTTGCWLSHLMAYYNISERVRLEGKPDLPVMILEDDIFLAPNATELINQAGEALPDDWELFFIGFKNDYCYHYVSPYLCRGSMLLNTHGYIVRNASVAEKLIHYANRDSPQVADIYWISLFKDILHIYLLRPTEVVRQNADFGTDIQVTNEPSLKPSIVPPPSPPPISPPTPPTLASSVTSGSVASKQWSLKDLLKLQASAGGLAKPAADSDEALVAAMANINNDTFASLAGVNAPMLFYELRLHTGRLGTDLGNFFSAACAAKKLGLHFVAYHAHGLTPSISAGSGEQDRHASTLLSPDSPFVKALPTVALHPAPSLTRASAVANLQIPEWRKLLQSRPWRLSINESCWAQPEALFASTAALRRAIIDQVRTAAPGNSSVLDYSHQAVLSAQSLPAESFHDHHPHHVATGKQRRLVPDAVVVFRCSDILLRNGTDMGFLSFAEYVRLLSESHVGTSVGMREIYVLGEPLHSGPWGAPCLELTRALVDTLSHAFPNTTVLVRRGYVFDSLAMITLARTVVCPPSLFCFWSALANTNGATHYAASTLVAAGQQPSLRGSLHWLGTGSVLGLWRLPETSGPEGNAKLVAQLLAPKPDPSVVYSSTTRKLL